MEMTCGPRPAALPWQLDVDSRPDLPYGAVAYNFLKQTPASNFYADGPAMPATDGQLMTPSGTDRK
jgi:hypothetical protein